MPMDQTPAANARMPLAPAPADRRPSADSVLSLVDAAEREFEGADQVLSDTLCAEEISGDGDEGRILIRVLRGSADRDARALYATLQMRAVKRIAERLAAQQAAERGLVEMQP